MDYRWRCGKIGQYIIFSVIFCLLGVILGYVAHSIIGMRRKSSAEMQAKEILERSQREIEEKKKEIEFLAKDELYRLRAQFERETHDKRSELQRLERRLISKEENLERRLNMIESKEAHLNALEQKIIAREKAVEEREKNIIALENQQKEALARISGMTPQEAKEAFIERMREEAKQEAALMIRKIEEEAMETADKKAREIISLAIQRCAVDHVTESTVTVVPLQDDDMKGRIIGREGRNIRALETTTGVDVIIDDTPGAVILSAFDPIRRDIARIALERLITDGRIHTARIEEVVEKAREEVEEMLMEEGQKAALEVNVHGLHPEEIKLLGTLKYRTSYGQNALQHSKEVALLAGLMAAELHEDEALARRIGLLHDIGKAVDHEIEGTHAQIGANLARKYEESSKVVHAIEAHHEDIVKPNSVLALLTVAADRISAARPGARRETLEHYIKRLQKLEEIADSFPGVEKAYAIQAGREIRVIVQHEIVDDLGACQLAKDIARKLEEELEYPGVIKVTTIRETRAVEYAK